ncbi:MAG: hypothetical protein GY829_14815 [Gammaproteobacteria bacterium]|nr:hypothetical protein [Gammaproteobacteria bacterium]
MDINVEEVVRQLTIIKNNASEKPWKRLKKELNKSENANPCHKVSVECEGVFCRECIFEDAIHRNNLVQTIKILEDNPDIIPTVELLC